MLKISTIKENCFPAMYQRGKLLAEKKGYKSFLIEEGAEGIKEVSAQVKGSGSKWYDVTVTFDSHDDIMDYVCSCPAYGNYFGMCKHCVALALAYRDTQTPRDSQGIVDFPVRGPRKRETSDTLKNTIAKYAVRNNAYLLGEYYGQVRLEPVITTSYNSFHIEFKIGTRKLYILRNICKMLDSVEYGKYDSYGKNLGFIHDRSAFTPEALSWIDLLSDYLKIQYNNMEFSSQIYSSNFRNLSLNGYGIDKVLQKYMDRTIEIDGTPYQVRHGNPEIKMEIVKTEEQGANIYLHSPKWIKGNVHDYLQKDGIIYQCTSDFSRDMMPIVKALNTDNVQYYTFQSRDRSIFLNREDYTAFCGTLLPVLEQYADIQMNDIDFDEYQPKEAECNVYLSMDEKYRDAIRMRAEAIYGDTVYNLFAQIDPASQYRDMQREGALKKCLEAYFDIEERAGEIYGLCTKEDKIYDLLEQGFPKIRELAALFVDDKIKGMRILPTPKVNIGIGMSGDLLDLDIQVEDMDLREMEQILSGYRRRRKYYRLKNGDFISLEDNGLALISELSQGLGFDKDDFAKGSFSAPKYRASYIAETLKAQPGKADTRRSPEFKRLIREMNSYQDNDFEIPEELKAELREYQKNGFRWLAMLSQWGFGGILADDMGLGKTLQVIALLEMKKEGALIVCPASLVYNWESEISRFAPDLPVTVAVGSSQQREEIIKSASGSEILVTSYDLLKRDTELYRDRVFPYMVIDEAQYIKNAGTQTAKAVKEVQAVHRLALTGTPIENRLSDLWSIFDFVMPGYLYSYKKFREELEQPIVQNEDKNAMERLKHMVNPFILRRKKQDVLKDLPDKLEKTIYVKMEEEQKKIYDARVARLQMELNSQSEEDYQAQKIKYLAELTGLRQICCSPKLCYENYRGGSAKQESCVELVRDLVQAEHRILLFSQFTTMLELLAGEFDKAGISYLYLSGKNTKEQRREMVKNFQNGETQVFLISLKAGGTGLNLTKADVVIHYDPWWNVAAQNQATDRTHRIGQENIVTVMKMVVKNTIEEKILALQEKKARLAENVMEGQAVADHRISRDELLELIK